MAQAPPVPTRGDLLWSGEHWIAYLRPPAGGSPTAMVSLYHAYPSPAGIGTAAFVQIQGDPGYTALCTDNAPFARFVKETQVNASAPYDVEMPMVDAYFRRDGALRDRSRWTVSTGSHQVIAAWRELHTPLVGPPTANRRIVFTILVFADRAAIELDGHRVEGDPYPREIWAKTLGRPMSSCVIALAETMVCGSSHDP